ncbi:hypothetical protein AB0E04_37855 [Streptomyces sp. NPDC048251]|uniref:hypothetical protein n=1 Tax=Streptomyces sp. NPDC048251 TaxID=3154501 RepID=UPI003436B710
MLKRARCASSRKHGRAGDGTLPLIVFMGAATCAALTLGGGAWLAGLLWWCWGTIQIFRSSAV